MKAVFLTAHGGNDVLSFGDRPDPVPGAGEVLVRIEAAALNGLDIFVRNGIPGVPVTFPHVPGADGTGVVEALGRGREGPRARNARRPPARPLVRDLRVLPAPASAASA